VNASSHCTETDVLAGPVDPRRPVSREFIEGLQQAGARDSLIKALEAARDKSLDVRAVPCWVRKLWTCRSFRAWGRQLTGGH
jgi:hypothetical protein